MNAIAPRRRPAPPALSDALPRLLTAPGLTLTWRPAVVTRETRIQLARLILQGTGCTVTETPHAPR
jgi:hypothetical protein